MNASTELLQFKDDGHLSSNLPTAIIETNLNPGTSVQPRRPQKIHRRVHSPELRKKLKNTSSLRKTPQHLQPENNITAVNFMDFLYSHVLTPEQLYAHGYPLRAVHNQDSAVFLYSANGMLWSKTSALDVHAREFVPRKRCYSEESSSSECSELNLEESSGFESVPVTDEGIQQQSARCKCRFLATKHEYLTQDICNYHWGKLQLDERGVIMQYSCCKRKQGSKGCTTSRMHVWDGQKESTNNPCHAFVYTLEKKYAPQDQTCKAYGVDCEMCYTVAGLELTKVTVVDMSGRLVYESFVKPKNKIIDYNTRFSGITAKDLKSPTVKTLKQVQNELRCLINAETILIGHGLENDLRALKMVHHTVVDTACSFPHFKGLPYRNSLKQLVACYLKKEIQYSSNGHDSYEDAVSCIELMRYKYQTETRGLHQ